MTNYLLFAVTLTITLCAAEAVVRGGKEIRFPGAAQHTRGLRFPTRLETAPAPYPAAGLKPEPSFELPTEEAVNSPEPTYGPPEETYGPPEETYGPPEETYEPPEEAYGPPEETYGPPELTYAPPEDINGTPEATNSVSTSAALDPRDFYPKTELTLPLAERLTNFRSGPIAARLTVFPQIPKQQPTLTAKLVGRPAQNTVKFLSSQQIVKPATVLTLPHLHRLTAFRSGSRLRPSVDAQLLHRPTQNTAKLSRPQLIKRPAKVKLIVNHDQRQQSFAQLPPSIRQQIQLADGIITYSERLLNW